MQTHVLSLWKIWLNKFTGTEVSDPGIGRTIKDAMSLIDTLAGVMDPNSSLPADAAKSGE